MKKTLIITAAILSVVFITSSAFSWSRGGYGRGCGGTTGYRGPNPALSSLTGDQRTQLAQLHQKFIDETYDIRSAMMEKHRDMQMLLETSSPDRAKLTAISDEILALKQKMQARRIDYVLAAKEISPALDMNDFRGRGRGNGMGYGRGNFGNGPCYKNGGGYGAGPCPRSQGAVQ